MGRAANAGRDALIAGRKNIAETVVLDLVLINSLPKTYTASAATDKLTSTAHGRIDGDRVLLRNDKGFLPKPLEPLLAYYVRDATANDLRLSLTPGGSAIDITWGGSGTNTLVGVNVIYLGAKGVTVEGRQYLPKLRPTDVLKFTASEIVDRLPVEVSNVDKVMGITVASQVSVLDGALGIVGVVHGNTRTGENFYTVKMPGEIMNAVVNEADSTVTFVVVSDTEACIFVGELGSDHFKIRDVPAQVAQVYNDLGDPDNIWGTRTKPWLYDNFLGS
ncbi:MAG TPA: hypothetical protein VF708_20015 [Pyrinomonadaceae bacterium]|jgi:hypothetical protein